MFRSTQVGPRRRRTGGFFSAIAVVGALAATPLAAQQPTRPDTTRRPPPGAPATPPAAPADTPVVRRDTSQTRADTTRPATPPPQMPQFDRPVPGAFSTGVWVFTRDSVERFTNAVTVADLLEMLPGVTRVRAGYYGQPETVSFIGQTAGRLEVFLDGYELSPLGSGVVDLSRIELAEVDQVRVERRLGAMRVDIRSLSPVSPQPYAYIQAGVAEPNGKLFRGAFLAPKVLFGPLAFGIDRLDTDGTGRAENASATAAWGKWSKIWRDRGGIQAEYRTNTVNRTEGVPWIGQYRHSDATLRARWQFLPGLVAEAYAGSSSIKDPRLVPDSAGMGRRFVPPTVPVLTDSSTAADSLAADSVRAVAADSLVDRSDRQIGARLAYYGPLVWGEGSFRTHSADHLPGTEGDVSLGLRAARYGDLEGGAHLESWTSRQVTETRVRARLGPLLGVSAFGELTQGQRGVPFLTDSTGRGDLFTDRKGTRLGVDLDRSWVSGGIARVSVRSDSVLGFGLPFDPVARFIPAGQMDGWESHARLRLIWKPLSAEYWYLAWTKYTLPSTAGDSILQPIYAPTNQYRASLIYHASPLKTGHLEIYARLDARSRGVMYDAVAPTVPVPTVNSVDFFLQIRILDVRIFFQEVGMQQQKGTIRPYDVPGRDYPAPRIFYGVRWQFFD